MNKNKNRSSAKSSAESAPRRQQWGLSLNDQDRILGGSPAPGPKPELPTVEEIQKALSDSPALLTEFDKMTKSTDKNVRKAFLIEMVKWTEEGGYNHERAEILAAIVWYFGSNFDNYNHYWKSSNPNQNKEK